jgi:hypothetical protein
MTRSIWHGIGVPSRLAGMYLNSRMAESRVCSILGVAIPEVSRASAPGHRYDFHDQILLETRRKLIRRNDWNHS